MKRSKVTHTRRVRTLHSTLLGIAIMFAGASPAQAIDYTWLGGSGNWTASNWNIAGFPYGTTSNVFIDSGNLLNSVVNLNTPFGIPVDIGTLEINAGDTLNVLDGRGFNVGGGTITNNGTLALNGLGSPTGIQLSAVTTLTGNGQTVLSGDPNTGFIGNTLTIGSGQTVRGVGTLAVANISNQGTVLAEHGVLSLSGVVNSTGTLAAAADGILLQSGSVTAQTINVAPGGSYALSSGQLEVTAFNGDFIQQAGTFAAGIGASTSTLTGNYTLNSGATLEIGLAGHTAGLYDQLNVSGNVSLAGNLSVVPQSGYSVATGDFFSILNIQGARSGTFAGLAEGASIPVGSSSLNLTYFAGDGNDVALVSILTPGSVNYVTAGLNDFAYVAGAYTAPSGSTTQFSVMGMDILSGSSFTLGANETLNLDNGAGTLNVVQGAVFTGNGLVQGSIHNAGLVRIPIVPLSQVQGGHVQVIAEPVMTLAQPMVINQSTVVSIGTFVTSSGGSGGGGVCDACGGGSAAPGGEIAPAGGVATRVYTIAGNIAQVRGTLAVDSSLEVTGSFNQTDTGALRLFVGGNQAANFGASKSGGSYSQLSVGEEVTLDGALQIVLQPELFQGFSYTPQLGDTFDFVIGAGGITLASGLQYEIFVSSVGKDMISGLTFSTYDSGILSDPDHLYKVNENIFSFALVDSGTVLRGTLIEPYSVVAVPEPETYAMMLAGLGLVGWAARRRKQFC